MDYKGYFLKLKNSGKELAKFIRFAVLSSDTIPFNRKLAIFFTHNDFKSLKTYDEWKEKGRQVVKGEKGYSFKHKINNNQYSHLFYYDITQTIGQPLDEKITMEEFETAYLKLDLIYQNYLEFSIEDKKENIKKYITFKKGENENGTKSQEYRGIYRSNENNKTRPLERFNDRTNTRDRGISKTREDAPIDGGRTLIDGYQRRIEQIHVISGRYAYDGELHQILEIDGRESVGRTTSKIAEENRAQEEEILEELSSAKHREFHSELQSPHTSAIGDRRNNLSRDSSSVRFRLSKEEFSPRGPKERFEDNYRAISILKTLEEDNLSATEEEKKLIARYVGWGGLQEAFNPNNESWNKEYQKLKGLLSEEEYKSASDSVLNSHYTPKLVIESIYKGIKRLGVEKGKALESSCGIGHFIGLCPENMQLAFDGIEIDDLTSRIAKILYPQEKITKQGFEDFKAENNTYDVAVGNVPFGDYKVYDSDYNKHKFVIHDYFIAKNIDKVKAGGIIALVTSKGTLDKQNSSARKYFAERAELISAFRLPNNTFKANAGTEAVTDILFFQKRETRLSSNEIENNPPVWVNSSKGEENVTYINNYYKEHPENILGEVAYTSGRFGKEMTILPNGDLEEQLEKAISLLPENIYKENNASTQFITIEERESFTSSQLDEIGIRNFSLCLRGNRAFIRENNKLLSSNKKRLQGEISGRVLERVQKYILLRNKVRELVDIQNRNCSDEELIKTQGELHKIYDDFVKNFGCVSNSTNESYFSEDLDYSLVITIEDYNKENDTAIKNDFFKKRTIKIAEKKEYTNDVFEALAITKNELGEVDIKYIEKLTRLPYEQIIERLGNEIYQSPDVIVRKGTDKQYDGWQLKSEFLSGNVVEKLDKARYSLSIVKTLDLDEIRTNTLEERIKSSVLALQEVQPKKLNYTEIRAKLGATWIDTEDYIDFAQYLFKGYSRPQIIYNTFSGQYSCSFDYYSKRMAESTNIWGTSRMSGTDILDNLLNSKTITVWDKLDLGEGKEKRVVNKEETALAREKSQAIKEEFEKWLWKEEYRRTQYEELYNRKFNNTVLPTFNGDYLTFDGMSTTIQLRQHQKDVCARIVTGDNTLLHHCVGAGKTYAIIASVMKLKSYGIATKPMIVVPKPLVMQWGREVKTLYPNAKCLIATDEEFDKKNRLRFISKIATGEWDMIVLSESQFRKIPVSNERQLAKMEEIISRIEESISEQSYYRRNSLSVKQLKQTLKKKQTKYKELQSKIEKTQDNLIKFEELGVDYLIVDEAHYFKNKEIETQMTNVSGITNGGSERAYDLEMKVDYITERRNGDKGIIFATGTPISNSMAEMYTMQSYLGKRALKEYGLEYFDAWASNFGEVITSWELNTSGSGIKPRTRFARFVNLPELQKMYRKFADVKTSEMLNLPVPKVKREVITASPTEQILEMNDIIIERGKRIENGSVRPEEDNMLKLTSDGKKLALDPRCFDSTAFDEEGTKVNKCINKVFDIYERTKEDKLTQVIFCDQSTPKSNEWSVYSDIKEKLIAYGVSENEIAFIHEADTDTKKEKLFEELNNGSKRILIGSTAKCGVGANFQEKLIALHHLDVPYRPADMEQREGRIIRQGNKNEEVEIYSYITEKTFDSYSYQILENKQRFISQINKGDMSIREASDIDEQTLSFAQIKAIVTANPDFLRQMELINTIKEIKMLKQKHYENNTQMVEKLTISLPTQLAKSNESLLLVLKDYENIQDNPKLVIQGQSFEERADAGKKLDAILRYAKDNDELGSYGNLKLVYRISSNGEKCILLQGNSTYLTELGESGLGNVTRIENLYNKIPEKLAELDKRVKSISSSIEELKNNVNKPFAREEELIACEKELGEIEERLQVNKVEICDETEEVQSTKQTKIKSNDVDENENE